MAVWSRDGDDMPKSWKQAMDLRNRARAEHCDSELGAQTPHHPQAGAPGGFSPTRASYAVWSRHGEGMPRSWRQAMDQRARACAERRDAERMVVTRSEGFGSRTEYNEAARMSSTNPEF